MLQCNIRHRVSKLSDGRGCIRWIKGGCPSHPHPSFTRCNIRRSTNPQIRLLPMPYWWKGVMNLLGWATTSSSSASGHFCTMHLALLARSRSLIRSLHTVEVWSYSEKRKEENDTIVIRCVNTSIGPAAYLSRSRINPTLVFTDCPWFKGNWNFRTKELSFPGTKVPWVELSFPWLILKGNFRSQT